MPLVTRQDYVITGHGVNDFNRDYVDYETFRNSLVKISEHASLFLRELRNQVAPADLAPHSDGITSIAIGYSTDLLVRGGTVFLFVAFSLFSPVVAYELKEFKSYPYLPSAGGNDYESVEFRNFPESKLCMAAKDAIRNTDTHRSKRGLEMEANGYAIAKNLVFPSPRHYPVKIIDVRPKYEKEVWVGYVEYVTDLLTQIYLLDIDNDGIQDLFDIITTRFGIDGVGSSLSLYQRVWIFDDQPVLREARQVKKGIGPGGSFTSVDQAFHESFFFSSFRKPDEFFPGLFYIEPFSFDQKNYLLFESSDDSTVKLFWVGELLPDGKLITHCYF